MTELNQQPVFFSQRISACLAPFHYSHGARVVAVNATVKRMKKINQLVPMQQKEPKNEL